MEDNIAAHLDALSEVGCTESELLPRLCTIDLLLSRCAEHLPPQTPRSQTLRPPMVESWRNRVKWQGIRVPRRQGYMIGT